MTKAIAPLSFLFFVLSAFGASPAPQCHRLAATAPGEARCPHQKQVDDWHEWRERNPEAHSRYPHGDHVHIGILRLVDLQRRVLSFSPSDDEEPAPDPGFGGCGCSPDVALGPNGCGWWMSNVYGFARSLIHR